MHAGVPRHLVFREEQTAEQLHAVLASAPLASVQLHESVGKLPPDSLAMVTSALAGSAATLAALRGFPLVELQGSPDGGLAAFTQLRALSLRQNLEAPRILHAAQLPASIEELTLIGDAVLNEFTNDPYIPPTLVGFRSLHSLRRITLMHYHEWRWGVADAAEAQQVPGHLPPSLEVCYLTVHQPCSADGHP